MVKRFWDLLSPYHSTFRRFFLILIAYEGLQMMEGYIPSLVARLQDLKIPVSWWFIGLAFLLVYDELFMRLDNFVDWHVITKQSYPIYKHLKLGAIQKFIEMDIPWHQNNNSGALVGKVSVGVEKVQNILDGVSWELVPTLIQTVWSLIPLLILSPITALAAAISFCFFFYLTRKQNEERAPYRKRRYDLYEKEWNDSIEIVQSIETNFMFNQTERMLENQELLHNEIISLGKEEARIGIFKYNRLRIRLLTLTRRVVLVIWVWQILNGLLDIPNFIFVLALTERLFSSFWRIARLMDRAAEASEGADRLANLMLEEKRVSAGGLVPEITGPLSLNLENVCFSYSGDYYPDNGALHDFTLEIPAGSIIALVGPSGAGKTTIRKVVTRLQKIQYGSVKVGKLDINEWSGPELLRMFSYVPQGDDVFIFSGDIKKNIAFPKPEASMVEIEQAAKLAGIDGFIESLPEKYFTQVGERGKRLSGGQKQRIALARAILADRPILILDEATSAVDAITEKDIQNNIKEILQGKTAIIIAHRLSTVWDIAHKIVVMDKGRKVEEGNHNELMMKKGLYAKMVALQTTE